MGRKSARYDRLAWSNSPSLLRELYSLFPEIVNKPVISQECHDNLHSYCLIWYWREVADVTFYPGFMLHWFQESSLTVVKNLKP
ncbi:hypothetical protein SFRURICE_021097 [Spodoptera frugiperda]|nr:hypothetical protein SFRURICE_021097 [Spodoptera frugiperda]